MIIVHSDQKNGEYVICIKKGEELVAQTLAFCEERKIHGAWLQGIGGCDRVEIGFYDINRKEYEKKIYEEELELVSLKGNIATSQDGRILHAHVSLGRRDFSMIGGHLFSMRISVVGEVFIRSFPVPLRRAYDPSFGVRVLASSQQ